MYKNSALYKALISDYNIFKAIYSLQSHSFEKNLMSENDLKIASSLRDTFDSKKMKRIFKEVRSKIESIIVGDDLFSYDVYFKPKGLNEVEKKVDARPIHSTSYTNQVALVAMLNVLLFKFDLKSNDKNPYDKGIVLSQIASSLPYNFYGNLISLKPQSLFQPWKNSYRKYLDEITKNYKNYCETEEYISEVSLDLQQFFPSVNPLLIYQDIIGKHGALFEKEDLVCFKKILLKLLFAKISPLKKFENEYYKSENPPKNMMVRGIPQGLPHAYFFGNLAMVKVAKILEEKFRINEDEPVKAYYYVDDPVIFCNINEEDLLDCINKTNIELTKMSNPEEAKKILLHDFPDMEKYIGYYNIENFNIKVHDEGKKSNIMHIRDKPHGFAYLNNLTREASVLDFERYTVSSEIEDISLKEKLSVLQESVEAEIKRVKKYTDDKDNTKGVHFKNYLDSLVRLKKFFKYRHKLIKYRADPTNNADSLAAIEKVLNELKSSNDKIKIQEKILSYIIDDTFLPELFSGLRSYPNEEVFKKAKEVIKLIDKCLFDTDENTYLTQIINKYKPELIIHQKDNTKYKSIEKKIMMLLPSYNKAPVEKRFSKFEEILRDFKKDGVYYTEFFPEDCYTKTFHASSDELKQQVLNAYASKIFSFKLDDACIGYPIDQRRLTLKEYRLLTYLRNRQFNFEKFHVFANKLLLTDETVNLDLNVLEVANIFKNFVRDPDLIDNLILIHDYTSAVWKNGSKHLHFYTLHNQDHAIELVKVAVKITKFLRHLKLNQLEFYVLFIACYLHDISMAIHPNLNWIFLREHIESRCLLTEFQHDMKINLQSLEKHDDGLLKKVLLKNYKKLDAFFEAWTRDHHGQQSADFIRKTPNLNFLENYIKELVAEVSVAHGYDVNDVYGLTSEKNKTLINKKYIQIVLRLADLFDMTDSRVSKPILMYNKKYMSDLTCYHWLSHQAIASCEPECEYKNKLLCEEFKEKQSKSFLEKSNFQENFSVIISLNNWQEEFIHSRECKIKSMERDGDSYILKIDGSECKKDCQFICRWMTDKHQYLFEELFALQKYLDSCNNYFKTNITVVLKRKPYAKPLTGEAYTTIYKKIIK